MATPRQLVAILFTDIAGYTAMMQEDEEKALAVMRRYTSALRERIGQYQGTVVNDYGDGNLCTFASATQAVRCAMELQRIFQSEPKVPLRMGLHIGEVFFEDGKALGDGVNVASRIQSLGVANSILFSAEIQTKISNQAEFRTVSLGSFHFKNVSEPMKVFALANEGLIVPEKRSMEGKLKSEGNSWKKWIAAAAVAILAVASVVFYLPFSNQPISVAVLAFEDMSPSKDQEWFSDGISEEVINSLANLSDLKITARTSSFYFKDKKMTVAEIAEKLDVGYIVEGSVRKQDNELRITVQLIDATNESHLFSQTYNTPDSDLFKVQLEIAGSIAEKLLRTLTPQQQSQIKVDNPSSVEAYEFYLQSRQPGKLDHEKVDLLLRAISTDPNYATAYGALADVYDDLGEKNTKYRELRDSVTKIGYRLNRNSPEVLHARYLTFLKTDKPDLDSAFSCLEKAHLLYPNNPFVHRILGTFYLRIGLEERAKDFLTRSIALDPLNDTPRRWLGRYLIALGELDAAEVQLRKIIELIPPRYEHHFLAELLTYRGDLKNAAVEMATGDEVIKRLIAHVPNYEATQPAKYVETCRATLLAAQGRKEEALKLSKKIMEFGLTNEIEIKMMRLLDRKQEALRKLDEVTSSPFSLSFYPTLAEIDNSMLWDFVRDEPEFKRIRERVKKDQDEKIRKYGLN